MSTGNPIAIVGNSSEVNVTVVHKELNVRPVLMYRCKIIDSTDSKSYTYSRPVVVKIETGMYVVAWNGYWT